MSDVQRLLEEAEARQLPAVIAEWWSAREPRCAIARALRVDLALLEERPELVLPCVYRRCGLADTDRIPGPWLRALRPPLASGAVEEYRTAARGTIAFSADASVIGVLDQVAWERATGRRVDPRRLQPPPRRRYEYRSEWGMIAVRVAGGAPFELTFSDEEHAAGIDDLGDAHALFSTYGVELEHAIYLVNVAERRIAWRAEAACITSLRAGNVVVVASEDAITTFALADGQQLARLDCGASQLAIASDGSVAARDGHVLRVCDVAAPASHVEGRIGWTAAAFSPDGTRLLTGGLLCDGKTGDLITELPLNSPRGWLLGGPPTPCQYLADDLLFELVPQGFTAWRARDGEHAFHDHDLSAGHGEAVSFDRNARHLAIARRTGTVELYEPRTRRRLAEHQLSALHLAFGDEQLVIECRDGARHQLDLVRPGELRAWHGELPSQPVHDAKVTDGILELGGAAIPIDEETAVQSYDGRCAAGRTSHYALEG